MHPPFQQTNLPAVFPTICVALWDGGFGLGQACRSVSSQEFLAQCSWIGSMVKVGLDTGWLHFGLCLGTVAGGDVHVMTHLERMCLECWEERPPQSRRMLLLWSLPISGTMASE
eukprot:scpid35813/ scgid29402/ 